MLRSYEYSEDGYIGQDMLSPYLFEKQIGMAKDFVEKSVFSCDRSACPVCSSVDTAPFFNKWGVQYLRCGSCHSVFAQCDDTIINEYFFNNELAALRSSDKYQETAYKQRENTWLEFMEWLQFRVFRYLGKRENLSIVDIGNPFHYFASIIEECGMCGSYTAVDSISSYCIGGNSKESDLVLLLNHLQKSVHPIDDLMAVKPFLNRDGLLVVSTRAGSGFDVLALKGGNERIFPYEHVLLPSVDGLVLCLEKAGFEVLEVMTPGVMDVSYVKKYLGATERDGFIRYLIENSDTAILQEFQRFLQKAQLSSYLQVLARKER